MDGVVDLYHPEAVVIPEPGKRVVSHAAIKELFGGFSAMGSTIKWQSAVAEGPGVAACFLDYTIEGTGPDGPLKLAALGTVVLSQQADGSWLLVIGDFNSKG